MVWMFISFIFFFSLLSYSLKFTYRFTETYIVCFHIFNPRRWQQSKLHYSCKLILDLIFLSIYCDDFIFCLIKHRTTLPCYCLIFFIFYLSYTKKNRPSCSYFKVSIFARWIINCWWGSCRWRRWNWWRRLAFVFIISFSAL